MPSSPRLATERGESVPDDGPDSDFTPSPDPSPAPDPKPPPGPSGPTPLPGVIPERPGPGGAPDSR